jgi:AraC-like DNA-binding protein
MNLSTCLPAGATNDSVRARLYLWAHRLLYIGPALRTRLHRHHAAQICWGFGDRLRSRVESQEQWQEWDGFIVQPNRPHAFDTTGAAVAILFVDPEGFEYAAIRTRPGMDVDVTPFEPPQQAAIGLASLATDGGTIDEADAICRAWLALDRVVPRTCNRDARLVRALQILQDRADQPVRLQSLANALHVSSSWLSHRFVEETGVPLRRYVVWLRLRRAVEAVLQGACWTEAAHAVGFSDSAHLSRSFRDNFGIAPSSLFGRQHRISVYFDKG